MVKRDEILRYLNDLLKINEFEDDSVNGLQVQGKDEVEKIVLGVSVSERLFRAAAEEEADMVIVHHGAFWKKAPTPYLLTGIHRNRMALLFKNDINLVAYHLPLDAHSEIGNNAQIMRRLEIEPLQSIDVGFLGQLNKSIQFDKFVDIVNQRLQTTAQGFHFGTSSVHRILVISGGSSRGYKLAIENNADTFLGGDLRENLVREVEEVGLNFINAGHYNTEKFGVQALGEKLQMEFQVICKFIDIPNPI